MFLCFEKQKRLRLIHKNTPHAFDPILSINVFETEFDLSVTNKLGTIALARTKSNILQKAEVSAQSRVPSSGKTQGPTTPPASEAERAGSLPSVPHSSASDHARAPASGHLLRGQLDVRTGECRFQSLCGPELSHLGQPGPFLAEGIPSALNIFFRSMPL